MRTADDELEVFLAGLETRASERNGERDGDRHPCFDLYDFFAI